LSTDSQKLVVLLYPGQSETETDLFQNLSSFLKKPKERFDVHVFAAEGAGVFADLDVNVHTLDPKASVASNLSKVRRDGVGHVILSHDQSDLLSALYQWWTRKSGELEFDEVYRIAHQNDKEKKSSSLRNRLRAYAFNLFTPSQDADVENRLILLEGARWASLEQSLENPEKDLSKYELRLLSAAHLLNRASREEKLEFPKLRKASSGFLASLLSAFLLAVIIRWQWFVTYPLANYKKTEGGVWSRRSPIWRFAFLMLGFFVLLFMPVISFSFGILWDEPDHINYADDVLRYFSTFGENKAVVEDEKRIYYAMKVYGISFDTFSALFYHLFSPFGIYETRHLLNALTGGLGMLFAGLLGRQLGGWRAGFLAFLIIFLSPYWFGHSMGNHKDIPFATGYIIGVYYLILFLKQLPRPRASTITFLILGIGLVISVRIGGLLVTAYTGLFMGLYWLWYVYKNKFNAGLKLIPRFVWLILLVGIGGFVVGILPWPYALENPLKNPFVALQVFTNFELLTIYEVYDGARIYMNTVPWHYIPKLILITSPLLAVLGWVFSLSLWYKNDGRYKLWLTGAIVFTIVFPVAYAVFKDSTLYNGWRHFLFIYPALAALAGMGWDKMFSNAKKVMNYGVLGLFVLMLGLVVQWQVRYHPHHYCYFNEMVGGYSGAYGKWELDSYGNSMRAGIERLIELEDLGDDTVRVGMNMTPLLAQYFANQTSEKIRMSWIRDYERFEKPLDYMILAPRSFSPTELTNGSFPPEGTIETIDIQGKPLLALVKLENDFMHQGYQRSKKGDYKGAIPFFQKAVDYDPDWAESRRMLGTCLLNAGAVDEGGEQLLKCVEINPDSYMGWAALGMYYARKNNFEQAVESLVKAIGTKINNSGAYLQLAGLYETTNNYYLATPEILTRMGQYLVENNQDERAVKMLNIAKNRNPEYAEVYQHLAMAYAKLGQADQMNKANRRYKKLTGNDTRVKEEIEKLREEQQ
jgi:tetratricopeptide (TPR) repeat protein